MNWFAKSLKALAGCLAALSPNCKEASRLQSAALDHRLPLIERAGLRVHLLLCRWCRRYGRQIRFLHHATREHPDKLAETTAATLPAAARERIKQTLKAEQE